LSTAQQPKQSVPVPEPDLTPFEMLRRAEALRPRLLERQQECEKLGRLPQQTHQDFVDAGFYRALQPRRFGGYEFSIADFARVLIEVSRGCSDSGWVLSILGIQPATFLCLMPEEAQREAFGSTGHCCIPHVAAPQGTAVATDGGFLVEGAWDYASGCDVATHLLMSVGVMDPQTRTPLGGAMVLLDGPAGVIIDNWDVAGMQGTGSRRVVVANTFVPSHRVLRLTEATFSEIGRHPGHELYANALYYGIPANALQFHLQAVAVGTAKGALDAYEEILRTKKWVLPPFTARSEMPELQMSFGKATALLDTAEAALLSFADRYSEACRLAKDGNREFTLEASRRLFRAGSECIELAWQATDLMFRTGGSASAAKSSRLGRYFRNLAVLRTHIGAQRDHTSINVARLHFGMAANSPV
jgi:3-hydroxy-9,10-secoandrosta-1,3,5(10)-triene-9,17-dione monooxygenase